MEKQKKLDLSAQIAAFEKQAGDYETFAKTLESYFENACNLAGLYAIVQARAKTLSSFTAKAIRKKDKYPDPINELCDLCGARIILHTNVQVNWVCDFIDHNFDVLQKDNVQVRLGENQFGYQSIHYDIKLKPGHDYGVSGDVMKKLAGKKAEIQVRTILQHAWSDIMHDRMYKFNIEYPLHIQRGSAMLAALMEQGDEKFSQVAAQTDNFYLNYSAYMNKKAMNNEIEILKNILKYEPVERNKAATALKLARLLSLSGSNYNEVIELLQNYEEVNSKESPHILLELGIAYCMAYRDRTGSAEYKKAGRLFERVITNCCAENYSYIVDECKMNALKALAYSSLARWYEAFPGKRNKVLENYREALRYEPANPYHLSSALGHSKADDKKMALPPELRIPIKEAINTCTKHARAGMELPQAYFNRGRLHLLLEDYEIAYGFYARGLQHVLDGNQFSAADAINQEKAWLNLLAYDGDNEKIDHIHQLFLLGEMMKGSIEAQEELFEKFKCNQIPALTGEILIVAGGASLMDNTVFASAKNLLKTALQYFTGTIISGGTTAGIPGLVGEVVKELKKEGKKMPLIGYLPSHLPTDAPLNNDYDYTVKCQGERFSADQLHHSWIDIIKAGIKPSDVKLLGINGGKISKMECQLAAMMGAKTGVIMNTGRSADEIVHDPDWENVNNLMFLPNDPASVSLFVAQENTIIKKEKLDELAQQIHEKYLSDRRANEKDESLKEWNELSENLKESNKQQISCAVFNLKKAGFDVVNVDQHNSESITFSNDEKELLAELEHGRWNAERLLGGWRYGKVKDIKMKISPYIVPWLELPETVKDYDRKAVNKFPDLLAKNGMQVLRSKNQHEVFSKTKSLLSSQK